MRRRKLKKQRKIIIISTFTLLLILSTGYAAFSTNINLNAKGNIHNLETVSNGGIDVKTKRIGDGLYQDTTENNRYIYKGKNPNNYITFNNELWRIIAKESDGTLKIIRKNTLGQDMQFDTETNRNNDENTYCNRIIYYDAKGTNQHVSCGIWAAINGT